MQRLNPYGDTTWSQPSTCPHLGMQEDPSTTLAYPSQRTLCYHCSPNEAVHLDHQRQYCLTNSHHRCPQFSADAQDTLPENLRLQNIKPPFWRMKYLVITVIVLSVVSVSLVLFQSGYLFRSFSDSGSQPDITIPAGSFPLVPALHTPSRVATIPATSEPATFTPSLLASTTRVAATPFVTIHKLDQPFGTAHRFLIHRMLQGESLFTLATRYNTTAQAIKNINLNMPDPVWVDWPVIIPLDTTDVSGIPAFETYQELTGGLSLEELAGMLNRDLSSLVYYNDLPAIYIISKGEWLILPPVLE
jgi:hypothetical protein